MQYFLQEVTTQVGLEVEGARRCALVLCAMVPQQV